MKTYRGRRTPEGTVVTVQEDNKRQEPLQHHVRHSPTGFEWGYAGSGPADLARCILLDYLGLPGTTGDDWDGPQMPVSYQDFKFEFVARFPRDGHVGWELGSDAIDSWLAEQARRQP